MSEYAAFLARKAQHGANAGFVPTWLPDTLFEFQRALTEWTIQKGRAANFADTGLGKTPMQLTWAENVVRHTKGRVLILTPLAVGPQTVREGEKFGIECQRSPDGALRSRIVIANYQRLHYFRPQDFAGVVCDESGCLKSYDTVTRAVVTEFLRTIPYRLLCSATPAPNDYVELGTSSEALGDLGFTDMLGRFFKNDQNPTVDTKRRWRIQGGRGEAIRWRFKGHAELPFWRWVASWARAIRKPSDLGFDDGPFVLPPLVEQEQVVAAARLPEGRLFAMPAIGLWEHREERRRTIKERCEKVAELVADDQPALVWCHLNPEGDLLEELIPDAVQVSGKDDDDAKEEKLSAFAAGQVRCLVTKPVIGAWGLNLQHCAHVVFFPSHSWEQYYQGVRRCWRFGQTRPVIVDIVTTEGERGVTTNLRRKAEAADRMHARLVAQMHSAERLTHDTYEKEEHLPSWL